MVIQQEEGCAPTPPRYKIKVNHKYAIIVKWGDIKNEIPKKLKISPVAIIPHKSNPFRCILDISLTLFYKGVKLSSMNEKTRKIGRVEP